MPCRQQDDRDARRRVSRVDQDDRGEEHRRRDRGTLALDPAVERERQERKHAPAQPRGDEAPPHPFFHAAPRAGRERERQEGAGQGEPGAPEHARQEKIGADAGKQKGDPEEQLIGRREVERAQRRVVERRAGIGEAWRIELQLGVARPPGGIVGVLCDRLT